MSPEITKKGPPLRIADGQQEQQNDILLQRAEEIRQRKTKESETRATGLINGEIKPPNALVAYLAQRIRQARQAHEQVTQQIQKLNAQLQMAQRRQAMLEGEHNSRIADLHHWDNFAEGDDAKKDPLLNSIGDPELETPAP